MNNVKMEKDYRELYTLADVDRARKVIELAKCDHCTAEELALSAAKAMIYDTPDWVEHIVVASAHTAKNCHIWNYYDTDTRDMDVFIEFVAKTHDGFIEGGAYVSDIWELSEINYCLKNSFFDYYTRKR